METPACPVRGHDHDLGLQRELPRQVGTGNRAVIWECPTGRYRWFQQVEPLIPLAPTTTRMTRPRFGWST